MDTKRKSQMLALGLFVVACAIEVAVLRTATVRMTPPAIVADTRLAHVDDPAVTPNGRRCDALDSFGNPIRPCRA